MKKQKKMILRFLLSVIIIFGMIAPIAASGAPRKSNGSYWPSNVTNIYFSYSSDQFNTTEAGQLSIALGRWNSANNRTEADTLGVNKKYMYLTTGTSNNRISYPVSWVGMGYDSSFVAVCDPYPDTGAISQVSIYLNPNKSFSVSSQAGKYHLQSIIVHEAGHALGVAHCHELGETCRSSTCGTNVMTRDIDPGEVRCALQPYDYSSYYVIYQ